MATTRLIPMHINKGKTAAKSLKDRTDYGKNPEKTRNGELVSAYACDPVTAAEDFLLTRRQYEQSTGRRQEHDVIAYQIRQSFKPGEVTAEEANQIGYETVMRFTKGNHAFFVATHIDKAHIHNHIYFNSTTLDGSRKFRNFYLSYKAVQQISDRICVQHGLSIVEPRPYREREKRTDYPEKPSFRDGICEAIDAALQKKPADFEALLQLLQADGYEIKRGKNIALKGKGQKNFIRMRSLGKGYSEEEIKAVLAGKREHQRKRQKREKQFSTAPTKLQLLIDIEAKCAEGKSDGYARWAKSFNLKQMAEAVCFVKEQGIGTLEELTERTESITARFNELSTSIKSSEERLAEIAVLKKHIFNYSKSKGTYAAYRKSGYSKQFLEEHREEITLHKAAKEAFDLLNASGNSAAGNRSGGKLPTIQQLNQEYAEVLKNKKAAYAEYRTVRKEMQDFLIAQKNVETILGLNQEQEEQKKELQNKEQQKDQNR
ncbi:MAG: relaxase/mobilization nuclease domain-containing protein [Lachnospiraceae bacterium]|nr:relaxase/mobilization nuclease domain-containing protein [Lachnospiraceae bacterium]